MKDQHCGTCYYFGWVDSIRWCFHPEVDKKIKVWGRGCERWLAYDFKGEIKAKKVKPNL